MSGQGEEEPLELVEVVLGHLPLAGRRPQLVGDDREPRPVERARHRLQLVHDLLEIATLLEHAEHAGQLPLSTLDPVDDLCRTVRRRYGCLSHASITPPELHAWHLGRSRPNQRVVNRAVTFSNGVGAGQASSSTRFRCASSTWTLRYPGNVSHSRRSTSKPMAASRDTTSSSVSSEESTNAGCALRAGANGSSTPTWSSAVTAPASSYA